MGQRYTAYIEASPEGGYHARFAEFQWFEVRAATVEELKAITPGMLEVRIDELLEEHDPVITSDGVDFVGPD